GKQEGALARLAQAFDNDCWDVLQPQQFGGFQPAVASKQHTAFIDEHWRSKANRLNAVGDLLDLFFGMGPRVMRMRLDLVNRDQSDQTMVWCLCSFLTCH